MPNQTSSPPLAKSTTTKDGRTLRRIPVLPVRDTVLFPHAVLPLTVGRESSIQLIESLGEERTIVVTAQLDPRLDAPKPNDMHAVGTLATVHKVVRMPNQSRFVFTEGVERVRLVRYSQTEPFMVAEVETLEDAEAGVLAGHRSAGAQRDRAVPADRLRVADALRRVADHCRQHRRAQPPGGLCGLLAALPDHRRQAATAGDGRASWTGWNC